MSDIPVASDPLLNVTVESTDVAQPDPTDTSDAPVPLTVQCPWDQTVVTLDPSLIGLFTWGQVVATSVTWRCPTCNRLMALPTRTPPPA